MTVRILTLVEIPEELSRDWLQHLRDFDDAHPGCHFKVAADAHDMSLDELMEVVQLDPPLAFTSVFKKVES